MGREPTNAPTKAPTPKPTPEPTREPTSAPTGEPTPAPITDAPTTTSAPSSQPSMSPTSMPSEERTKCGVSGKLKKKKRKTKLGKKKTGDVCSCEDQCKKSGGAAYEFQLKTNKNGNKRTKCFCYQSAYKVKELEKSRRLVHMFEEN